ncbi:MAG: hypothetical protein IJ806_11930 [Ruminococcus sp.]|nr:hypothetical protein [Ruminococcus sp.]
MAENSSEISSKADSSVVSSPQEGQLSSDYSETVKELFAAEQDQDMEKIAYMMYPREVADGMLHLIGLSGEDVADNIFEGVGSIEFTEIIEEGPMTREELDQMTGYFDQQRRIYSAISDYGKDFESLSDEELLQLYYETVFSVQDEEQEPYYKATEGYDITARYIQDGEAKEDSFFVYYIDGEGWKISVSMRSYVQKAKRSSANSNAKSLMVALTTVLVEMDAEGIDVNGHFTIGSEEKYCRGVPDGLDLGRVGQSTATYFEQLPEFDYFAVAEDGVCVYCAVVKKEDGSLLATYPLSSVPESMDGGRFTTKEVESLDGRTIDELFKMTCDTMGI